MQAAWSPSAGYAPRRFAILALFPSSVAETTRAVYTSLPARDI
jgi:hypothetical protein